MYRDLYNSAFDCEGLLKDLVVSLQIPSIKTKAVGMAPFGIEIDNALRHSIDCASKIGFRTFYGNGYYGYAEIGQGEELIGVLCHVDVVPTGQSSEWNYDPFSGIQVDGKIWGRGTLDDKGPLFASLYAMKRLNEEYPNIGKRIRLIIGADEEVGWECIKKYKELEEIPNYGFSPDAEFPVVNGEKGIIHVEIISSILHKNYKISGGMAPNIVPELCKFEGPSSDKIIKILEEKNIPYTLDGNTVSVIGKAAHASVNWQGINAISRLCQAVAIIDENNLVKFVAEQIGTDPYGARIFGDYRDEESGPITINPAMINISSERSSVILDIRIPVTKNNSEVVELLNTAVHQYGLDMKVLKVQEPLYISLDNPIVTSLSEAYEEVCNEKAEPITMGGGTYAKAFNNFVAFGPLFPGEEDTAHCANENVSLESLFKSMEIYYQSLKKLIL